MKPARFRLDTAAKHTGAAIAVIGALGLIQINLVEVKVPGVYFQKWGRTLVVISALAIGIYLLIVDLILPWVRRRKALRELRHQVSVTEILAHYGNRSPDLGNPVVLSCLRCDVKARPGEYPRDLEFVWDLEGTNTSDTPLGGLELTIAGSQGVTTASLNASCCTESPHGLLNTSPMSIRDRANSKRLRLPFAGAGPDTGESFKCRLEYSWPKMLLPARDYFFFETSNFGHTVNHIDFSLTTEFGDYRDLYLYRINLESGSYDFLGSGDLDKRTGTFRAAINKPSNASVYVLLIKS